MRTKYKTKANFMKRGDNWMTKSRWILDLHLIG